ncbi:MAG: dicarboxylate/amino acid:cation symporter [Verrucomicrobiaceae bacterium]|nr:dicarboxylate/amino acid:cation symporter [Verrucomicrobiaceae bacterium]
MKKMTSKLHWQVAFAILVSVVIATLFRMFDVFATPFGEWMCEFADFLGKMFMRLLSMIIVPLVSTSVVCGCINLGGNKKILSVGSKTIAFYILTGIIAVGLSLIFINVVKPGQVDTQTAKAILGSIEKMPQLQTQNIGVYDTILKFFPPNIMSAATDNTQLLGLIFFAIIMGIFINTLPEKYATMQRDFWESTNALFMKITDFIMKFLPIGVFGLTMPVFVRAGTQTIGPVLLFFVTVVGALMFHMFITMSVILKCSSIPVIKHIKTMMPLILTGFSTSSSVASLPVTMDCVKKAGVSNDIAGFTIPLGATVNMNGTALYECMAVIFISQICVSAGICAEISLTTQVMVIALALMTSVGVAGIPSASLVAIALIMGVVGIPVEAIGIIWITDRLLDMMRTSTNIYGDACATVWIAQTSQGTNKPYSTQIENK